MARSGAPSKKAPRRQGRLRVCRTEKDIDADTTKQQLLQLSRSYPFFPPIGSDPTVLSRELSKRNRKPEGRQRRVGCCCGIGRCCCCCLLMQFAGYRRKSADRSGSEPPPSSLPTTSPLPNSSPPPREEHPSRRAGQGTLPSTPASPPHVSLQTLLPRNKSLLHCPKIPDEPARPSQQHFKKKKVKNGTRPPPL